MNHADLDRLIAHVARLPDHDVIKALATATDYTPEARVVYESEAKRRGIRPEAVHPVAVREAQEKMDQVAATRSIKGIGAEPTGSGLGVWG